MKDLPLKKPMFFIGQEMEQGRLFHTTTSSIAVFSSRSPDKETLNEDCAMLIPLKDNACVLVVADGAGGQRAGSQASQIAVQAMHDAIKESKGVESGLRGAILNGIENANRDVMALGLGAYTTLAVVEVQGSTIRPYHVGDSEILITGQRGKVKLQTLSHAPVAYAVEAGLLDQHEAMHHEERHIVTNMIGCVDMRIDIGPQIEMTARDTLVAGSDGLYDNLLPEEIINGIRKGSLRKALRTLSEGCQYHMQNPDGKHPSKPDDLTFIILRQTKE